MQPTLNELSLTSSETQGHARQLMSQLVQTLRAVFAIPGTQRVLRAVDGFDLLPLSESYPIRRWQNDLSVDADERSYFRSVSSYTPAIDAARDGAELASRYETTATFVGGSSTVGLCAAYLTDALCVSLGSDPAWDTDEISITVLVEEEASTAQVEEIVPHASTPGHVARHAATLSATFVEGLEDGDALFEHRASLFPALSLGNDMERALASIGRGDPHLAQTYTRLERLNRAGRTWETGVFDHATIGLKATPEHEGTLSGSSAEERKFHCSVRDGFVLFSWHLRLTPGAWRLYYDPVAPGCISVGYVGAKMSTARHKA